MSLHIDLLCRKLSCITFLQLEGLLFLLFINASDTCYMQHSQFQQSFHSTKPSCMLTFQCHFQGSLSPVIYKAKSLDSLIEIQKSKSYFVTNANFHNCNIRTAEYIRPLKLRLTISAKNSQPITFYNNSRQKLRPWMFLIFKTEWKDTFYSVTEYMATSANV